MNCDAAVASKDHVTPTKSATWEDEITDSESEDVSHPSKKLERSNSEDDLYLEIIKKDIISNDIERLPGVTTDSSSEQHQEVITVEDKDSSEDEKVNQYLDDIERKLEDDIKKRTQPKVKDDWKLLDYFKDIICVKEVNVTSKNKKTLESGNKKVCKRRRKSCDSPTRNARIKKRRNSSNVTLSEGEIISDEELILSDLSLSPEKRSVKHADFIRRDIDQSKDGSRVQSRKYTKKSRCDYNKHRSKLNGNSYDHSLTVHERKGKKRMVQVVPESSSARHSEYHKRSHRSNTRHSDHRRHHCSPEIQNRKRSTENPKSKRHCKCENKREGKSKLPSDYFDEDKYHGSDKSRIRTLKKKYDEYLKYAKKFKNDDEDSKHFEKFAEMRSRLKGEDIVNKHTILPEETSSIDYKKEEEKFLRSLETYLEIKKKQEKSMSSGAQLPLIPISNTKEYDPDVSSEEEEYVPEKFTPEDISVSTVEEYDPCSVSNISDASFTYEPTKIDEYEPVILRIDEEYCPMPVENTVQLTYNPTKKFSADNIFQSTQGVVSKQPVQGWMKTAIQYPRIPEHFTSNIIKNQTRVNVVKSKPNTKVISRNTVFIGNIVNPLALNDKSKLVSCNTPNVSSASANIDKSKIMSRLVHEKLLEIEKKKLQLLEEIHRKKLLKIKEKCDEVALRNLEKKKSDLILEIYTNTNIKLKPYDNVVKDSSHIKSDSTRKTVVPGKVKQVPAQGIEINNIEIKKEKNNSTLPLDSIPEKISALQKKKADLMLEISRKQSMNSERINKDKAELTSKLEALEKNKSMLLAQVFKKEAKDKKGLLAIVKKEIETPNTSSIGSRIEERVNIKQEKETLNEKPFKKTIEISNNLENITKNSPIINDKLNQLEQEKAKLMAQIAAKSNQVGNVSVIREQPKLKVLRPEVLDEKLGKLAKEKEKLLLQIEEKKTLTESKLISDVEKGSSPNLSPSSCLMRSEIKKEKDENSSVTRYKISIKQEKEDVDATHKSKVDLKKLKQNENSHLSSKDLSTKINELEKQKAQLMQTLANKLPLDRKTNIISEVKTKVTGSNLVCKNALAVNKTNPVAIIEHASQVKLKVSQQLSEITKKKMELMKQIDSMSLNTTKAAEISSKSAVPSSSMVFPNVQNKLSELEKNKSNLLMEIEKRSKKRICDEKNIVEKTQDNNTDVPSVEAKTSDLTSSSEINIKEKTENSNTCSSHKNEFSPVINDDGHFKIPEIPRLKNIVKSREKVHKNKIFKAKLKRNKYQKPRMKTMLSQKKITMLKRFRKLNTLKGLWGKSVSAAIFQNKDNHNASTLADIDLEIQSSNQQNFQIAELESQNSVSNNLSCLSTVVEELKVSPEHDLPNDEAQYGNESGLSNTVINEPVQQNDDPGDEVKLLETPLPVPKQLELITIEEDDASEQVPLQYNIANENVVMIQEDNYDEDCDNNEFITLRFIKVEKLSHFDGKEDNKNDEDIGDGGQDKTHDGNENSSNIESDQSKVINEKSEQSESTFNEKEDGQNVTDEFDSNLAENNYSFNTTDTRSTLNTRNVSLDGADDDVILLKEMVCNADPIASYYKNKSKVIGSTWRKYNKNNAQSATNSPIVSKLILNNRRKLISAGIHEKNRNLLNISNPPRSSVFKLVRLNPLKAFGSEQHVSHRNKLTKRSTQIMERLVNLSSLKEKKLKIDNRGIQIQLKQKNGVSGKNSSLLKFDQFKLISNKSRYSSAYKTSKERVVKGQEKSSMTSKYKLINITNDTISHESSVIAKFKLVNEFCNRSSTKLNNYKNLPLFIRRQVINRFKLSNTNMATPNRIDGYSTKKKFIRHLNKSKSKILKSAENNQYNSLTTPRKSTKSRYKICRVLLRNNSSKGTQQEGSFKSTNKTPRRSSASKKYHLNSKVLPRCTNTKPSQLKINHLVSKYKMIRFSNQRERNKMNLSQRVQESSYPNRTMKVIKLHGTSYKVSSRSLKRKVSSCLEAPSTRGDSPAVARRVVKAQLSGNIFSNRHIIGRHYLTSSRLRSLAVLTSRLRKNNVQLRSSQCSATTLLETKNTNRTGYLKGSAHIGGRYKADPDKGGNNGHQAKQTFRNLSFQSHAEVLKHRRTSRHRANRRQSSRRKYSPPPCVGVPPSDPPDPDTADSGLRYFDSDNPRSNIKPGDDECVETVIPRRTRKLGALPGFIPL